MSQLTRKSFLQGTAAVAGTLAVAPRLVPANRAPAFNKGVKRTIQFWAFTNTRTAWQQKAWALYQDRYKPDFDIDWVILPYQQMFDKLMIVSQAGSGGPDIADVEISQFGRFTKGDVVYLDLTSRLQKRGALPHLFRPAATDPWSWQGKIYGIGNELNTCLLSYRWDILDKAGIKMPIATWGEFVDQAKKFHKDTGNVLLDFPFSDWGSWWMQTLQQGGGFFGSNGQITFNSPMGAKVLAFQQHALYGPDKWSILRPLGQAYDTALSAGTIASLLGPSWNFSGFVGQTLPQTAGKWHLQLFPRWTPGGSRTATQGGTGVTVLKSSPLAAEAADFVVWEHTTSEAVLFDYGIRQTWPTWRPAFTDPRLTAPIPFFGGQRVGKLIEQVSPELHKWYNSPFWSEATDAFTRLALTPAILNNAPVMTALQAAQRDARDIISFETT